MFITIPINPVYIIPSLREHQLWDTTQKSFRGRTVCPWSITNLTTNIDSVILIAQSAVLVYLSNAEQNWHSFMYVLVLVKITMVVLSNEGRVNGIRWSNIWFSSVSAIRSVCPNLTHFIPTSLPQFQLSKSGKWRHPSVRQSVSLVNIFPPSNSFWILIRSEKHSRKFAESSFGKMDWTFAAHLNPIRWTESYFHTRSIFVMLWFQLKPNSDAHLDGTMNGQLQIVETL